VARVALLCADLLFGSKLESALAEDHELRRFADVDAALAGDQVFDVLVVDLTDPSLEGVGAVERLRRERRLDGVATLGFYAHVERETRASAEAAGFDRVVPRSRMAREARQLVAGLADA
jgi:CheY-like chemotaxis protein